MGKVNERQKKLLLELDIDGWLLFDFQGTNQLALRELALAPDAHLTRRLFYWIPKEGEPVKLLHAIEESVLDHLPGEKRTYASHEELAKRLGEILKDKKRVAMEISKLCHIPYLARVDYGTVELVQSFGCEVVSSSRLIQEVSVLTPKEIVSQRHSTKIAEEAVVAAWRHVEEKLPLTEYDLQQFLHKFMEERGQIVGFPPLVAVNANSANPHYIPTKEKSSPIQKGDILMIDIGCKEPNGIFSDITKMALVGRSPTKKEAKVFATVLEAQTESLNLIKERWTKGATITGAEVDALARKIITDAGFGNAFLHRLGHSVTESLHGSGAHLDSFETLDDRPLLPNTCSTIEPGIYLKGQFGVRLECDLLLLEPPTLEMSSSLQSDFKQLIIK